MFVMEIKRATIKDVTILTEFRKIQLMDEGQEPIIDIDETVSAYFKDGFERGVNVSWIVYDGEVSIACGSVVFLSAPPSYINKTGEYGYIHSIYTDKKYRGQGIATKLTKMAIEEAKRRGVKVVRLQASEEGLSVYEKVGFVMHNEHMILRL